MSLNIIFFPLLYWLLQIPAAPTQFSQGGYKVESYTKDNTNLALRNPKINNPNPLPSHVN